MNKNIIITSLGGVALLGAGIGIGGVIEEPVSAETVQKIDADSFKTIEPVETVKTISGTEQEIESLLNRKVMNNHRIATMQADNDEIDLKVAKLQAQIAEAKKQGVN